MLHQTSPEYAYSSHVPLHGAIAEVLHAGAEKCPPGKSAAILRDHYLLHLVLSGRGVVSTDGAVHTVSSHECFLLRPGQEHMYQADTERPWEYVWLGFSGVDDETLFDVYGVPTHGCVIRPAFPARMALLMRRILTALQSPSQLEQLYSLALGVLALGCIGDRVATTATTNSYTDYVEEAVAYIEAEYPSISGAAAVARYIGLDRSYFSRLFQERTGVSVSQFITETRITHAQRLLSDTRMRVSAIAEAVGYRSYQSFERRFTAQVGMTPSGFRTRPPDRIRVGPGPDLEADGEIHQPGSSLSQ